MRVIPNHVTNKLLFHPCTEKRFNEILADLQKEGAEPGSIDLGRIIPEPEGLFMGDLGVEEMKKYKDNNWYDWRIKHWNTKWNAYGFEPPAFSGDTGTMIFRTANCSPFPVIFKLSQKYPDVEIDLRYADEDIGYNVGEITVCAGELIDDSSPQYGSATARELAADILGLNLDFDLNTGSGYVVTDAIGNQLHRRFTVVPRLCSSFHGDFSAIKGLQSVTVNGEARELHNGMLVLDADGNYKVTVQTAERTDSFQITVDATPPTLTLSGVENGGETGGTVRLSDPSEDAELIVTKDGEAIAYRYGEPLTDAGVYYAILTDACGNQTEYRFVIIETADTSWVAFAVIAGILALGGVGLVLFRRRKLR